MNKKGFLSKILVFILLLHLFILPKDVYAQGHQLKSIDIFVDILEDGRAKIMEIREAHLIEGTENYIVIGNLGESEILDFKVTEDGTLYQSLSSWDTNLSREEKKYKSGVIQTADGYELCWGIGEYGDHIYQIEYTITNFVKQYQDKQAIFWKFINDGLNIPPEQARVTLRSPIAFTDANSHIWAFGYEGDILFKEGTIVATSHSPLKRSSYLTILVELEDGIFRTTSTPIDTTFEEIKAMAFKGSDYGTDASNPPPSLFAILFPILGALLPFILFLGFFMAVFRAPKRGQKRRRKEFKGEYYRKIPYEGSLDEAYYALSQMGMANRETLMTGLMLRGIHDGDIKPEKYDKGGIFSKEETGLKLVQRGKDENLASQTLYQMMLQAAGTNGILEKNEFTKWAKKNYRQIEQWDEQAKLLSKEILKAKGYLTLEERKFLFFKYHVAVNTTKGEELEERVYKFINYLSDFSLLNEHEAVNVAIWDDLMIWAGLLGITEKVEKEFQKIYPRYETESVYQGHAIHIAHAYSRSASSAVSSRSSGGGGSSSSGGGGGASGGGSGGGTR